MLSYGNEWRAMKSVNLRESDLPFSFTPHIEYMKKEDKSWHFNPQKTDSSAVRETSISISRDEERFIHEYAKDQPVEIGTSVYEGEKDNFKENSLVWRKLDHVHHGYTEHNTKMNYMRQTYQETPDCIKKILDQTGLTNASVGIIRLKPGNIIPWHYDSYIYYNETNQNSGKKNPERHIIFPESWHWGHIYQIGNNVISNWKGGDRYSWPNLRYHLAANVGIKDFIMLAVTGVRND